MDENAELEEIDYVHPEGKPKIRGDRCAQKSKFDGREVEAASKREKTP